MVTKNNPTLKKAGGKTEVKAVPYYAFRIELDKIRPKIWRYFYVNSTINLNDFHNIIQDVMGWSNYHLYFFTIFGNKYIIPDMDDLFSSFENIDPFKVKLNKIGLKKNDKFTYLYDFGDDWYHTIKVMSTDYSPLLPDQDFGRYGGRRACPPEDCGGPWGYVRLLEILADPRHEEYEEMREWTGDDFDPEAFSLWLK